jgi:hypothetical protein
VTLLASTVLLIHACGRVPSPGFCADFVLSNGLELAKQGEWAMARQKLLRGHKQFPRDHRFPVELGGIAFREKRYATAARWVRAGLKLNPRDEYALDFLGAVHFLNGNPGATLWYWNRVGKPRIRKLQIDPALRIDPVLLDRAFTFAPGSLLRLSDWRSTRARVQGLQIFPLFDLRLDPQPDGAFDVSFTARERNRWGATRFEALASALRGVGFQAVHAEYFNISRQAANFTSFARWDRHKRRLLGSFSSPLHGNPQYRYQAGFDARDESWDLTRAAGGFQMTRVGFGAAVTSIESGSWNWTLGGELSHRRFGGITVDPGAFREALFGGYQLKQTAELNHLTVQVPSRRLEMATRFRSEAGRNWPGAGRDGSAFGRLSGGLTTRWAPRLQGNDYAIVHQLQAGNIVGRVPLDDFYMLGMERDNDGPWMRAHAGTRGGRKGSAPLVRKYLVSNLEIDKNVYSLGGLLDVKLSPFLDVGKGGGVPSRPGGSKWMLDTGAQVKLRVLGTGFSLIYGRDLRTGNAVLYLTASR